VSQSITEQFIAGADLSTKQYLPVYIDGSDDERVKLLVSNTSILGIGFLENTPADNAIADVTVSGYGKGTAGGVLEPYDDLMVDGSTGKLLVAAGAGKVIVAQYRPGLAGTSATGRNAASGDTVRIWVYENMRFLVA